MLITVAFKLVIGTFLTATNQRLCFKKGINSNHWGDEAGFVQGNLICVPPCCGLKLMHSSVLGWSSQLKVLWRRGVSL